MNKQIVKLSINIDLIEQARLYPGRKGRYLDATLFLTEDTDQYGNNGFIVQSVTKEEREAGVKGPIIGNVKLPKNNQPAAQYPTVQPVNNPYPPSAPAPRKPKAAPLPPASTVDPEDLPF